MRLADYEVSLLLHSFLTSKNLFLPTMRTHFRRRNSRLYHWSFNKFEYLNMCLINTLETYGSPFCMRLADFEASLIRYSFSSSQNLVLPTMRTHSRRRTSRWYHWSFINCELAGLMLSSYLREIWFSILHATGRLWSFLEFFFVFVVKKSSIADDAHPYSS